MITAHVAGLPLEETVVQLAPAAVAVMTGFAVVGARHLATLRRRLRELATSGREGGN